MKKTKAKPCSKVKNKKTAFNVKKVLKTKKPVANLKKEKKPKITIGVLIPKSSTILKRNDIIEVPRSITTQNEINKESTSENEQQESLFDIDGQRKKRRGRNKKEKIYFSRKTEDAIIEYNSEEDENKRNEIYETKIKFSFY